jgi:hypothetical protein
VWNMWCVGVTYRKETEIGKQFCVINVYIGAVVIQHTELSSECLKLYMNLISEIKLKLSILLFLFINYKTKYFCLL